MKKTVILLAVATLLIALVGCATTGGLPTFGAEIGSQSNPMPGGDPIRIAYSDLQSYYGYVMPGSEPDAVVDGKNMYFLYLWVPIVAPEIGVRMISPVPEGMMPEETDFVSPLWEEGKEDMENYFDTWITLERALMVINPEDIEANIATTEWIRYDSNDDSSEMPVNPGGSRYNSLMRIVSEPSDPLRALVRGLYRIGFTTYKRGEVQGTFLAQVGAPVEIPGVVVAKDIDDMIMKIEAAEE